MTIAKPKTKKGKISDDERALLRTMLNQLNGVLVCTLATCEGLATIPEPVQGALFAAARLSQDAKQML